MGYYPVPKWNLYVMGRYRYFESRAKAEKFGRENGLKGYMHIRKTTVYMKNES